jgi:hypothetical protein
MLRKTLGGLKEAKKAASSAAIVRLRDKAIGWLSDR